LEKFSLYFDRFPQFGAFRLLDGGYVINQSFGACLRGIVARNLPEAKVERKYATSMQREAMFAIHWAA
jgi:hypothetical protein